MSVTLARRFGSFASSGWNNSRRQQHDGKEEHDRSLRCGDIDSDENPLDAELEAELPKEYVIEHPMACKRFGLPTVSKPKHEGRGGVTVGCAVGDHGGQECISAFLGETNWSRSKVGRVIEASEKKRDR